MKILQSLVAMLFTAGVHIVQALDISDIIAHDGSGFIDASMTAQKRDGRDPQVESVFEQMRQWLETQQDQEDKKHQHQQHPMLTSEKHGVNIDVPMQMVLDLNHVIGIKLTKANNTLMVIPDTKQQDLTLFHSRCDSCWTSTGTTWSPDVEIPLGTTLVKHTVDFSYMMHLYQTEVEGHYWMTNACLNSTRAACATSILVYAIQQADPWIYSIADGYMGLAPGLGWGGLEDNHNNFLEQMYRHKMIASKVFGVHTQMWNSTENPSEVRFGGYHEDLFGKGHDQIWLKTLNNTTWEVNFSKIGFSSQSISNHTRALINPGFPFIGMPKDAFDNFKVEVEEAYPDEPVTCTALDWCFFYKPCESIQDKMPNLKFDFVQDDGEVKEFEVPPKSFLYSDFDKGKNITVCHLGVVGQQFNNDDAWVLGQAFMENFYVTFDASDSMNLKIGLSAFTPQVGGASIEKIVGAILVVLLGLIMIVLCVCICVRQHRLRKIEQAKTYFDKLQAGLHDEDDPTAEQETEASAKWRIDPQLEASDPNSFISQDNDNDDEVDSAEVSSAEARDKVDNMTTSNNEMLLGNLI